MHPINPEYMTEAVVVSPPVMFGDHSMRVRCGNCHRTIQTMVIKENGACAYIACLAVCLLCCPCFWIPLCLDSCKDVHHSCPGCGARLGAYKKI